MPSKKTTVRYLGGLDSADVHMPISGMSVTVERGGTVELLAADAKNLLGGYVEEVDGVSINHPSNPDWEPVTKPKPAASKTTKGDD